MYDCACVCMCVMWVYNLYAYLHATRALRKYIITFQHYPSKCARTHEKLCKQSAELHSWQLLCDVWLMFAQGVFYVCVFVCGLRRERERDVGQTNPSDGPAHPIHACIYKYRVKVQLQLLLLVLLLINVWRPWCPEKWKIPIFIKPMIYINW